MLRPYTTINEVQRETKNSGSELNEWYGECITTASRIIDEKCHRDFWYHDHREEPFDVVVERVLGDEVFLPFPIIHLTEVRVARYDGDSLITLDSEEYRFRNGSRSIKSTYKLGDFGEYPFDGILQVKGEFGYMLDTEHPNLLPPPTIPSEVRRACTLIAANISVEKHLEQVGLDGNRVELLSTMIPTEANKLLSRWKEKFTQTF